MEEAQESMDCSDSEMIPSSPKEEAGPEQEDIPEIGMEQDVAAVPALWLKMVLVMAEMFSMLLLLKKTRLICNELSNLSRFLILRGRMCM